VSLREPAPEIAPKLRKIAKEKGISLLKITPQYPAKNTEAREYEEKMLNELTPVEVFERKWSEQFGAESLSEDLIVRFRLLQEQVSENA
jgi:hypothetical protein